jgi:hypothetical protein
MGVGNGVARNAGLTNTNVHALTVSGTSLVAGTSGGMFITKKGEGSWIEVPSREIGSTATAFAVTAESLFAATSDNGIFLSTNNGQSW